MDPTDKIPEIEQRLKAIDAERIHLLNELRDLKARTRRGKLLALSARGYPTTASERIDLFASLFAARPDIYPRWWRNESTGKSGYSPVCESVWEGGRRLKPTEIFARYGARKFSPLSSSVIEAHLRGTHVVGTYAIRPDDTCIFLAADFDGSGWKEEAGAFREQAARLGIDCLVEISRSGNGAHAWIFFAEPIPASLARSLGSLILARTAARQPQLRLDSYDRFFPNQSHMPKGGFGNLIALPLQKQRRSHGFTEFVDELLVPYDDQWKVLAQVHRLGREEVLEILEQHAALDLSSGPSPLEIEEQIYETSRDDDLELPVLPDWKAWLTESLVIPTQGLPAKTLGRLKSIATFPNPIFFEKQRHRFPVFNVPRYIFSGEVHADRLILPRGCIEEAVELFAACGSRLEIEDRRLKPKAIRLGFKGTLSAPQESSLAAMLQHDLGVLVAPPGSGKTVIGCALAARRRTPVLVLVNRQALLTQWLSRLREFLNVTEEDIGSWRGARKKLTGRIDVVMIQTLAKSENPERFFRDYGMVVIDECHHVPAVTLEALMKGCGSRYIVGLTATPERKDRLEQLLFQQCGPIRHVLDNAESQHLIKRVHIRRTSFSAHDDDGGPLPLHVTWQRLVQDAQRNQMIVCDIVSVLRQGRVPLVLSDRKEQLEKLLKEVPRHLSQEHACMSILEGSLTARQRTAAIETFLTAVEQSRPAALFATASLLGEGFDLPVLDTLFLTMPISFKGRLVQYAGRLHRAHPGKTEVIIYDYLDEQLALTLSMFRKRLPAYRRMGYAVVESGEAVDRLDLFDTSSR